MIGFIRLAAEAAPLRAQLIRECVLGKVGEERRRSAEVNSNRSASLKQRDSMSPLLTDWMSSW